MANVSWRGLKYGSSEQLSADSTELRIRLIALLHSPGASHRKLLTLGRIDNRDTSVIAAAVA
jgi:hypothetical protein